ncbi:MAG: 50S ribosomal protein L32 [Candidatus Gottesmanbacteria bacterium]
MTPLPKRRHSTRRGGKRKAAIKLRITAFGLCSHCHKPKQPHTICPRCGFYDGKEVQKQKVKKTKKK